MRRNPKNPGDGEEQTATANSAFTKVTRKSTGVSLKEGILSGGRNGKCQQKQGLRTMVG
jgi:hypothetical protein